MCRPITLLAGLVVACIVGAGCGGGQKLTQAQLNAIETREVDATLEATFAAATGALFDAGYTVAMSDRQAGLLTGQKGKDRTMDRIMWSPSIADDRFTISISMRSIDASRTAVRIKTSVNGEPKVNKKAIDQIWTLMQRQVLMKEPLSGQQASAPAATSTSSSGATPPHATAAPAVRAASGTTVETVDTATTRLPPRRPEIIRQ
jgi:hypothetical protein